jgi:DNA-binding PadR family transcriptional regulator
VQEKVLALLYEGSSHGYEICTLLGKEYSNLRLNTLYRWLSDMEEKGLVKSEITSCSSGINRRVYRIIEPGMQRMLNLLQDSIKLVLRFYEEYQRYTLGENWPKTVIDTPIEEKGRILFSEYPRFTEGNAILIEHLAGRTRSGIVDVIGRGKSVFSSKVDVRLLSGSMKKIPVRQECFREVWLSGLPDALSLHSIIPECKRVLVKGGILRVVSSRIFSNIGEGHSLDKFIKATSVHLFPEVGVIEVDYLRTEFQSHFGSWREVDVSSGIVVFSAQKL